MRHEAFTPSCGVGTFIMVALALLPCTVSDAAAQESSATDMRQSTADTVAVRSTSISPGTGPAGTKVIVEGQSLPAVTPVRITIGGTRSGFESLAALMTDRYGSISDTVEVPEWVERHRTYKFFVVDIYFKPLSESGVFHATDSNGVLIRRGRVIEDGAECTRMRGDDGELYSLIAGTDSLESGQAVVVEGTVPDSSRCMHGTTLEVERLRPAPSDPS